MKLRLGRAVSALTDLARHNRGFTVLLAAAALLRLAVWIAYRPILFFDDSVDYVSMAADGSPVAFAPTSHPSGYPLLVEVLSGGFRSLAALSAFQHLMGLVAGALVYAMLVRLGTPRKWAVAASAVVLLDLWLIALEQYVATETTFLLMTTASAFLVVMKRSPWAVVAGGALLGLAATVRPSALFAVPVWLAYLLWARLGRRAFLAGLAAVIVPVLGYSVIHHSSNGWFGLSEADGWLLYGRTAEFADCRGAQPPAATRPLCLGQQGTRLPTPVDYVFTPRSPAWSVFEPITQGTPEQRRRTNSLLRDFALTAIRSHPRVYARTVADGTFDLFVFGVGSTPPAELPDDDWKPTAVARLEEKYFPGYKEPEPNGVLLALQRVLHTPNWLMGLLAVAALASLVASFVLKATGRRPLGNRRETFLLSGMGIAVLVGSVATSNSDNRFLLTGVPLLVAGGVLGVQDLVRRRPVLAPAPRAAPSPDEFAAGDALRGLALITVVLTHLGATAAAPLAALGPNTDPKEAFGPLLPVFLFGPAGMAVFFCLSGYLIGRPFVRAYLEDRGMPRVGSYARNRLLRLVPAFWVGFLVSAILVQPKGNLKDFAEVFAFLGNRHPGQVPGIMPQAWSIDVELLFYLMIPVVAFVLTRLTPGRLGPPARAAIVGVLLAVGAVAGFSVATSSAPGQVTSQSLPLWFPAFAGGLALAAVERFARPRLSGRPLGANLAHGLAAISILGPVLVYISLLYRDREGAAETQFGHTAIVLIALCILAAPMVRQWSDLPTARILRSRVLRWLGERSYSFYIWHYLPLLLLAPHIVDLSDHPWRSLAVVTVVELAVLGPVGMLSYRYIELPFLSLKRSRRRRPPAEVT